MGESFPKASQAGSSSTGFRTPLSITSVERRRGDPCVRVPGWQGGKWVEAGRPGWGAETPFCSEEELWVFPGRCWGG